MASQRPPWLRFMRPATTATQPPVVQPTIPIRAPPPPPPLPQEPAPPPPPPSSEQVSATAPPPPAQPQETSPPPSAPSQQVSAVASPPQSQEQPPPSAPSQQVSAAASPPPPQPPPSAPSQQVSAAASPPPPQPQEQPPPPAPSQQFSAAASPPPSQPQEQPLPPSQQATTPEQSPPESLFHSPLTPRSPEVAARRSPPKDQVFSSPQRSPTPPPPPSSSPATKTQPVSPPPTVTTNVPAKTTPVTLSPKAVVERTKTPTQSPKADVRPPSQSHHPSPLTLPPAHINSATAADERHETEFEQKKVLVQDSIGKPQADHKMHHNIPYSGNHNRNNNNNNNIAAYGKQVMQEKAASGLKQSDHVGIKVITLSGENKGAAMELSTSPNSRRKTKSNNLYYKDEKAREGDKSSSASGDEETGKNTIKDKAQTVQSSPANAFVNSNVQGINNSIVIDSTCRNNDPGVHLTLSNQDLHE